MGKCDSNKYVLQTDLTSNASVYKQIHLHTEPLQSLFWLPPCRKAEASGKDYEAIISRSVLLKPLAGSLRSYPNIYEPEVTCVEACLSKPLARTSDSGIDYRAVRRVQQAAAQPRASTLWSSTLTSISCEPEASCVKHARQAMCN